MVELEELTKELEKLTFRNVIDVQMLTKQEASTLSKLYKNNNKYKIYQDKESKDPTKYFITFRLKYNGAKENA